MRAANRSTWSPLEHEVLLTLTSLQAADTSEIALADLAELAGMCDIDGISLCGKLGRAVEKIAKAGVLEGLAFDARLERVQLSARPAAR